MRKAVVLVALVMASTGALVGLGASSASADPIGPCEVYDAPSYDYNGRTVTVDLHTSAECFKVPASVG